MSAKCINVNDTGEKFITFTGEILYGRLPQVCVCVCVCVRERERERVFLSHRDSVMVLHCHQVLMC